MRKRWTVKSKISSALALTLAVGAVVTSGQVAKGNTTNYNYGAAFQKTLMFYEFQQTGKLENVRNNWRGDSGLNDGKDVNLDLTGGWLDAGDNVKFNLPMAYSSTMLAWSYLESEDVYKTTGEDKTMKDELKWVNDYFIKCHPSANEYYYQVGDGGLDHSYWGAVETIDHKFGTRKAYKVDLQNPGSAVTAEAAASLASAAIVFKNDDPAYAQKCLKHAKELLNYAETVKSDAGYQKGASSFYSSSHFYDELSWALIWLYKATGDKTYLAKAKQYSANWGKEQGSEEFSYGWSHCWDDVSYGTSLLIAQNDKSADAAKYKKSIENNLDFWTTGYNGKKVTKTAKGLAFLSEWGSLRYSSTAAFLASIYADWDGADKTKANTYQQFAKEQADYILGSSGRSYIVGLDSTSPKNPHHRTAHGTWDNNLNGVLKESRHTLVGALVGGPGANDDYSDVITDYCKNEVACDYNAGAHGLMAKMFEDYGNESQIDKNLTAYEKVGEEFTLSADINAQNDTNQINFVEMKVVVENKTAWPARVTKDLKYRFYVDISDVLAAGHKANEMKVESSYSQHGAKISALKATDKAGIYYVEVDLSGADLFPGGQSEHKDEVQFRISAPGKWNYAKSPSLLDKKNIPLYEGGKLVLGQEPSKGTEVQPSVNPTTPVPTTPVPTTPVPTTPVPTTPVPTTPVPTTPVPTTPVPTTPAPTTPVPTTPVPTTPVPTTPVPTTSVQPGDATVTATFKSQQGANTNTLGGSVDITTNKELPLGKTVLRYYFTAEGNSDVNVTVDNIGANYSRAPWYEAVKNTTKVVKVSGNKYYAEIKLDSANAIKAGDKLSMGFRITKADWSNFDQTNDFSYTNGVVVIANGKVVSGQTLPY